MQPTIKMPEKETKATARVLTSVENRLAMQEKERLKKQKEEEKQARARMRLLKQQEKQGQFE